MKTFEVMYQAAGAGSGKTVNMKVFKEDHTEDVGQATTLTEIGTTGRYHGVFDADSEKWSVQVEDNSGGKCVMQLGKRWWVRHIVDLVGDVQTAIDTANVAIGNLATSLGVVDGKVDVLGTNVDSLVAGQGSISTDITALGTAIATIEGKIDDLESPPMIG